MSDQRTPKLAITLVILLIAFSGARRVTSDSAVTSTAVQAIADLEGGIIIAASCSQGDVQAAVDAAQDGDTVLVPDGSPCTWTTQTAQRPAVLIQEKGIVLRGAGPGKTVIHIETGANFHEFGIGIDSQEKPVQVTQFTFISNLNNSQAVIGIYSATSRHWRIDHNHFYNQGQRAIWARGTGVVDHCYFRKTAHGQGLAVGGNGDTSWNEPLSLGTDNAVYVEDSTFAFDGAYDGSQDAYNGARYVFRYNQVNGTSIGHHGFDSGNYRSTFSYEIYNNVFDASPPYNNGGASIYRIFRSRGGTGVIFNNTAIGNYNTSTALFLTNYRSCPTFEGHHTGSASADVLEDSAANFLSDPTRCVWVYNITDGSYGKIITSATTATTVEAVLQGGTRNNWQPGDQYAVEYYVNTRANNSLCMGTGSVDGNQPGGEGYPCMDQPGRTADQALAPTYQWNNSLNGTPVTFEANYCQRQATLHVLENRDFYNRAPQSGDAGYYAYSPYTYPHPLTEDVQLTAIPLNSAARLNWDVVTAFSFPISTTWHIKYATGNDTPTLAASGLVSTTNTYDLSSLANGVPYTITLNGVVNVPDIGETRLFTDTTTITPSEIITPTGIMVYLPLVER